MKYNAVLLFCLCLVGANVSTQVPLYDAIQLTALLDDNAPNKPNGSMSTLKASSTAQAEWYAILAPYTGITHPTQDEFYDAFFKNPLLSDQPGAKIFMPNQAQETRFQVLETETTKSLPAPKSGSFVTNFADGFARFLVKRTKEELTLSFFRKFKSEMEKKRELGMFFPASKDVLRTIDVDVYQFQAYAELLKQNFRQDMKSLPYTLFRNIQSDSLKLGIQQKIALSDGLSLAKMSSDGATFVEILDFLADDAALQNPDLVAQIESTTQQKWVSDMATGFKIAQFFSNSLRNPELTGGDWLDVASVRKAFSDKRTVYLYLGLLWMKAENKMVQGKELRSILAVISNKSAVLEEMRRDIIGFTQEARDLNRTVDSLAGTFDNVKSINLRYLMLDKMERLLEFGLGLGKSLLLPAQIELQTDTRFFRIFRQSSELQFNVRKENYVAAIGNLTTLLGLTIPGDAKWKEDVFRYGAFIATVAEARDSKEVSYALEVFALPPGSSGLKKQANFSVALNAYTGLGLSQERIIESATPNRMALAVSAPIGIGANWGFQQSGSLGIFIPVIDIGAITAFRFKDPETSDLPELNWSNIWAPGAYVVYGFFNKIPLSLGAGWQIGPNLRSISSVANPDIDRVRASRFQVFMSVDIPIAHFYTR